MSNPAIIINSYGGPEVLEYKNLEIPQINDDEILIRHTHIGINFIDTYFRSGLYKGGNFPIILGAEAAGIVEKIGKNISDFQINDRVCYTGGLGAYCTYRAIKPDMVLKLPENVPNEIAAGALLKGLTAQYLLRRTFLVNNNHSIFYHAAAGGVGLIFGQWARHLGAKTIGTAGSDEKCELARNHGFDEVINYRVQDFVSRAIELNGGKKYDVVYDSVGNDTFPKSLDIIKPLGLFVSFGQSSGAIAPFDIGILNQKGSLFMTRPSLFAYNANSQQLRENAAQLFELIGNGTIKIEINQKYSIKDAAFAHSQLESRKTTGTSIFEL
jgi:NADPH:quinone reductase